MVSNAKEDFPEPLGPVTTVNLPSGRSTSMPLRLFWRAPRTSIQPTASTSARFFVAIVEPTGDYRGASSTAQLRLQRNYTSRPRPPDNASGQLLAYGLAVKLAVSVIGHFI